MNQLQNRIILHGDVLEKLKEIAPKSIDCIITSPPYWGLRDYKVEDQWGLEKDFHEYLKKMRQASLELKRVLKSTGSCWINMGDSYGSHRSDQDNKMVADKQERNPLQGYEKSLMMIPWEFVIQCRNDGWTVRNVIPWIKENAMPSSVRDRFTNKWEPVFFMTKARKYYFNLDAIREKSITETKPFNVRIRDAKKGLGQLKLGDDPRAWKMSDWEDQNYNEKGERKQDVTLGADSKPLAHYKGFNERWNTRKFKENTQQGSMSDRIQESRDKGLDHEVGLGMPTGFDENGNCFGCGLSKEKHINSRKKNDQYLRDTDNIWDYVPCNPKGKNPGDIFRINPRPFPEAHFATFPVDLPIKILKCACPDQVCKNCGIPREPIIESNNPSKEYADYENDRDFANTNQITSNPQSSKSLHRQESGIYSTAKIIGWTKCDCNVGFEAGTVLDPFFGAGTVGVAAEKLGLNWIGIELNIEYVKIARRRIEPYNNIRLLEFFEMTK